MIMRKRLVDSEDEKKNLQIAADRASAEQAYEYAMREKSRTIDVTFAPDLLRALQCQNEYIPRTYCAEVESQIIGTYRDAIVVDRSREGLSPQAWGTK